MSNGLEAPAGQRNLTKSQWNLGSEVPKVVQVDPQGSTGDQTGVHVDAYCPRRPYVIRTTSSIDACVQLACILCGKERYCVHGDASSSPTNNSQYRGHSFVLFYVGWKQAAHKRQMRMSLRMTVGSASAGGGLLRHKISSAYPGSTQCMAMPVMDRRIDGRIIGWTVILTSGPNMVLCYRTIGAGAVIAHHSERHPCPSQFT
ncbi:hypothetical protein MSG28_010770 [Choristoneura fumiferana]|uniref:Uncharacterized protein n=1 Tax=Choristoneura fumiferana TaxID=7141 RepID=A0ACC0KNJ9_CHOFU|nr:hypothetical protein MSG28_010770 [Choristoneura fumiferana]